MSPEYLLGYLVGLVAGFLFGKAHERARARGL